MVAAFTKTLDIARRLGDCEYQLRALSLTVSFFHLPIAAAATGSTDTWAAS